METFANVLTGATVGVAVMLCAGYVVYRVRELVFELYDRPVALAVEEAQENFDASGYRIITAIQIKEIAKKCRRSVPSIRNSLWRLKEQGYVQEKTRGNWIPGPRLVRD